MSRTTPEKTSLKNYCVYCGSRKELTRDHIPPKCLFAKPLPQDLITVPCCRQCNNSASSDDEYFRSTIVLRRDSSEHPEAKKVSERVWRSLEKPEAGGLNKLVLGNVRELFHLNERGFFEPGMSFNVDLQRLDLVASRIVRGLFWKEFGERLPNDYVVSAFNDSGIANMDENTLGIFRSVLEENSKTVGNKVFRYWRRAVPENKHSTAWILLFYESVWFFCFTVPKSRDLTSSKGRTIS